MCIVEDIANAIVAHRPVYIASIYEMNFIYHERVIAGVFFTLEEAQMCLVAECQSRVSPLDYDKSRRFQRSMFVPSEHEVASNDEEGDTVVERWSPPVIDRWRCNHFLDFTIECIQTPSTIVSKWYMHFDSAIKTALAGDDDLDFDKLVASDAFPTMLKQSFSVCRPRPWKASA